MTASFCLAKRFEWVLTVPRSWIKTERNGYDFDNQSICLFEKQNMGRSSIVEITQIELKNFRNYKSQRIDFQCGLNLIVGDNAQGKTNIVEAVMLCAVGRSPRTAKDKELIHFESDSGYVRAEVARSFGKTSIELYITRKENKRIKVNEIPISKMGELMGSINAVFFSPDELSLIKEAPEKRRRFLDMDISQLKKSYFYMLKRYNEILVQRNNLLKRYGESTVRDTIDIWNVQLAKEGAGLIIERKAFLDKLKGYILSCHEYITDGREKMNVSYSSSINNEITDVNETERLLLKKLEASLEKDRRLGFTGTGPHRDDIKVEVNGIDIRSYGSQGQQRTAALSMKLAELKLFHDITGEYPILLLDDVLSELDDKRQKRLIELTENIQTVITATNIDANLRSVARNVITVKNGSVIRE